MKILAFETSCDDTAVSIIENGTKVLSNVRWSQAEHEKYGGVVPELAARLHAEHWPMVLARALDESKCRIGDIDYMAVTQGPGLQTSLLNGTTAANFLAQQWEKKVIPVHHVYGHMVSVILDRELDEFQFPALVFTASGGHTQLALWEDWTQIRILGQTRDDAAGEAFDKCAKLLGLGYPGGPIVSKYAEKGNEKAFDLPRIYLEKETLDFSFSGLKASVYRIVEEHEGEKDEQFQADVCSSFQAAVRDIFVRKLERAIEQYPEVQQVHFVGGVSANTVLRTALTCVCERSGLTFFTPAKMNYCTDNAAMIGAAAYLQVRENPDVLTTEYVDAEPRMGLS